MGLLSSITEEEVKSAVFSMHPEKALGINEFNPAFYQSFWDVVKNDVIQFCQRLMCTGELPNGVNRMLVCLIPFPMKSKPDSWFWLLDTKGDFTVRGCYRLLRGESSDQEREV